MTQPVSARFAVEQSPQQLRLVFCGRLDAAGTAALWHSAMLAVAGARGRVLELDLHGVAFCDMAGAALFAAIQTEHGGAVAIAGAADHVRPLLQRAEAAMQVSDSATPAPGPGLRFLLSLLLDRAAGVAAFVGEAVIAMVRLPRRRRMLRLPDLLRYAEQAGSRSLPLVILLGFLIGLILAFQSAIPMRKFGADLYVANLVAVALLRELGPLLASVILAGRTGSAFAAEIGTMKVNGEVDALTTMGLDPMTMLVLPRILAVMLVMPAMTLVLDVSGLLGMTTVMRGFGFPMVTIAQQVQRWVNVGDLVGGLGKAMCFGAAVAGIGCRAGLATGVGPRAVGLAATAAVVGGIVATILLDGAFALIFYRLGL